MNFSEVVIGPDRIKIEKEKVKVALNWLVSKLVKEIQKFLRLVNYYIWFIKDFSKIARPLYELTRKEQQWE